MEIKKSKKAQIERLRGTWLLMGFVIALSFMFVSFEWANHDVKVSDLSAVTEPFFVEDMVPITIPEVKPPEPPAPEPAPAEVIEIINNTDEGETGTKGTEDTGEKVDNIVYKPFVFEPDPKVEESEIVVFAEEMPSFNGGVTAMYSYLNKHIKYPSIAQEMDIQGKVIVQFVVEKDGSIANPVVIRGVDPNLDKEALRVIKSMPKWNAGKQNRIPVRVRMTIPVSFKLQ